MPTKCSMRSTLAMLLLACLASACTALPPLPPGTHFEQRQRPTYVPVYQERAELHRVYQLIHPKTNRRVEYYEDQFGRHYQVEDVPRGRDHHWQR